MASGSSPSPLLPYYDEDGITIYHADCSEVLRSVSIQVDVTITDPPYGVGFVGKAAKQRDGVKTVNVGGYDVDFEDSPTYIADLVVPVIEYCRLRSNAVVLTPGTRNLWAYAPADDVGCFYSAGSTGMGRWGFTCMQPILYYGKDPFQTAGQGARANSHGQTYPNDANTIGHPCAKPLPLWRWLVGRCTKPGHLVLDPFMGSGTTLVAAKSLGCRAIGIEISERYCELAAKRLAQGVLPL